MTPQLLDGLQWWSPIPWILAAGSAAVAFIAFRRSRHPALRIHRLRPEIIGRHPDWKDHGYLRLELICFGADIFDLEVFLECDHSYRERGRSFPLVRRGKFVPLDNLPNPVKNGQMLRFELGDHEFRYLKGRRYHDTRTPSQLWPGRVRIAAYHSGQRLLFYRSAWRFRRDLREFDSLARMDGDTLPPYPRLRAPDGSQ